MILDPQRQLAALKDRFGFTADRMIPGGIHATDHVHVETLGGTCSRCRQAIREGETPLLLPSPPPRSRGWLIYCSDCGGRKRDDPEPEIDA